MLILVINPNSTSAFTRNIATCIQPYEEVDFEFLNTSPPAPRAIDSVTTGVLSASASYAEVQRLMDNVKVEFDGFLVACFSSHLLVPMLREALPDRQPVVGIFDAALLHASQLGTRFGIVTTDARWEPLLTEDVRRFGFAHRCAGVVSSGLSVLEAESLPREAVARRLAEKAKWMVETQKADVIILGCAGFVGLEEAVKQAVGEGVPIVDGVQAGVETLIGLIRTRQKTSSNVIDPTEAAQVLIRSSALPEAGCVVSIKMPSFKTVQHGQGIRNGWTEEEQKAFKNAVCFTIPHVVGRVWSNDLEKQGKTVV